MTLDSVKTLADLVAYAAESFGKKTYIKEKCGKDISEKSFAEFYEDTRKMCSFIKEKAAGEKIHVAIIGPTCYNYLISYFGAVSGGNVSVPLDAQLACEDLCDLIERADVSMLVYDPKYAPMLDAIKAACPAVHTFVAMQSTVGAEYNVPQLLESFSPAEPTAISPDDLAAIVYTSGTTGKAKGVMLTHGNLIDNASCLDNESSSEEVLLSVLPIHHVYCFTCDILLSMRYGATVCVNDSLLRIAQNMKLFKPTLMLLVPMIITTIYKQIVAVAKSKKLIPIKMIAKAAFGGRLRGIYSGGAYLSPEIIEAYAKLGIPVLQGYGMTECSPRITTSLLGDVSKGDVGKIVNRCEVKIVEGEILVKSPSVMQGYYKNPEATAETLTEDGWLRTGDLGYVDEERRVFITGRKKNLIILSNGENVSPEEIENKFANVDMAAEVLVYDDDSVITAEIFPNRDLCANMTQEQVAAELHKIIDNINKTLTSSKAIRRLRIRDKEFDKTTSRKIRRNQSEHGAQA